MKILFFLCCLLAPIFSHAGGFAVSITQQLYLTATTTSTQVLASNPYRNYLIIQNNGSTSVIVKFGSAQSASEGIIIPAGGNYEPYKGVYDAVFVKSASSTDAIVVIEGQ